MDKERVGEIDKLEQEDAGSIDITIEIRKPYLGSPDCPLPAFTTIDQVGNLYRICAPDIDTAAEAIAGIRDRENKEPTDHRPAAMAAIRAELESEIRKSEAGMEERWWPVISNEVKKLVPVMMAAPELLEAAKGVVGGSIEKGHWGYCIYKERFEDLAKAIKKAEGECS